MRVVQWWRSLQWASNTSCGGVEVGEFQFLVGIGDVTTHRT